MGSQRTEQGEGGTSLIMGTNSYGLPTLELLYSPQAHQGTEPINYEQLIITTKETAYSNLVKPI